MASESNAKWRPALLGLLCLSSLLWPIPTDGRLQILGRLAEMERTLELRIEMEGTAVSGNGAPSEGNTAPAPDTWPHPWPESALQGHEQDLQKVQLLHTLISAMAINNTVIVVPANLGFMDEALNLRCLLLALGSSNVLLWALDDKIAKNLTEMGIEHFYDSSLFSVTKALSEGNDIKESGIKWGMLKERPKVWWRLLATGFDLFFLDADVVALRRPEEGLERTADFEGQLDFQRDKVLGND